MLYFLFFFNCRSFSLKELSSTCCTKIDVGWLLFRIFILILSRLSEQCGFGKEIAVIVIYLLSSKLQRAQLCYIANFFRFANGKTIELLRSVEFFSLSFLLFEHHSNSAPRHRLYALFFLKKILSHLMFILKVLWIYLQKIFSYIEILMFVMWIVCWIFQTVIFTPATK